MTAYLKHTEAEIEEVRQRSLPQHKLIAYQRSLDLLRAVVACGIRDARLREQATKSSKSACLNIAEAAGRWSAADRARIFQIARGEACESAAAVEIAALTGDASKPASSAVASYASELFAMLTALIKRPS